MIPRMCIQWDLKSGETVPCSRETLQKVLHDERVKKLCERIGKETDDEQKSKLKKQLPALVPHAQRFAGNKRKAENAVAGGLVMLDVDHVAKPREWFAQVDKEVLKAHRIYFVAITPSGHGLRIIGERTSPKETISSGQARLSQILGITEYDGVTKDLSRMSFMMPSEYVMWLDEDGLYFKTEEESARWAVETALACGSQEVEEYDEAYLSPDQEDPDKDCFRGIPYKDIVDQLLTTIGSDGGAVQGERNTVYFSLANYMRYITDFDGGLLFRILPDFGLSGEERRSAIRSALGRPRKTSIPLVLESSIALLESGRMKDQKVQYEMLQTSLEMPPLPPLYQLLCKRLPAAYRPAMVIAALPILGALATRIRFRYLDQQEHSLSFFSCVSAPAASGKSFIRQPIQLLLTPINEQDQIEREKEQVYKERLRASKNSKNQPEDPRACPRNNGVNISIAKLLQLLTYSEGKHLIGIGEEMDSLLKSEKAGVWSQKSDIYRLAFDNAEYGQSYMSDQSFSAHVPVYYNLLMTGTPNSMKRFFKDLENGLATRVCFATLPDTSFTELPVFSPYTEKESAEIVRQARMLDKESGSIECSVVEQAIGKWLEEKRQQAIEYDNHAMDTFRRRASVIGYRAGMLCYLLYGRPNQQSRSAKVNHRQDIGSFATWIAEYVFRGQMELWGKQLEQEMSSTENEVRYDLSTSSLLSMLPTEFETSQLIHLRAKAGQSVNRKAVAVVLSRWKQAGKIEKIGDNRYKKSSAIER